MSTTNFNTCLADEHVVLPGGVVVDGLWRLQQEPDDVDDHLDEDEARAEEQLRLRGDEARPLRRPLRRVEDAGYPAMRRRRGENECKAATKSFPIFHHRGHKHNKTLSPRLGVFHLFCCVALSAEQTSLTKQK